MSACMVSVERLGGRVFKLWSKSNPRVSSFSESGRSFKSAIPVSKMKLNEITTLIKWTFQLQFLQFRRKLHGLFVVCNKYTHQIITRTYHIVVNVKVQFLESRGERTALIIIKAQFLNIFRQLRNFCIERQIQFFQ